MIANGQGCLLRVSKTEHCAARCVVTVPAPQAIAPLGVNHPLVAPLAEVLIEPCLTLMAAVTAPASFVSRDDPDDLLAWCVLDSSESGRWSRDVAAWAAQAGPSFAARRMESDEGRIVTFMLPLLCDRLGIAVDQMRHATAHRWRYARATATLGQPFLRSSDASLYFAGGWCLGARVQAAWASGTAAAENLLVQIR